MSFHERCPVIENPSQWLIRSRFDDPDDTVRGAIYKAMATLVWQLPFCPTVVTEPQKTLQN